MKPLPYRAPIRTVRIVLFLASVALLGGCQQAELGPTSTSLSTLEAQLAELSGQLDRSEQTLIALSASDRTHNAELEAQLAGLNEQLDALPDSLELTCPPTAVPEAQCEEVARVIVSNDKMLLGELEYVFIDPPGINAVARIDTGATSSSIHGENLVPFERDGEDWVRFDMVVGEKEPVTVERKVLRHVRVVQQADPEGSRRPVVEMRVRLGDIQDTFEFTLADRSHLENELILGRNFLADVTLVDVGSQFIQPRYSPPEPQ